MTLDQTGFGESLRGGGAICFGAKAIDDFLSQGNMSYIVRAHEAHSEGVSLSKGAKVFTVFSTSKDHGQGKGAMCGCILVDFEKLLVGNIIDVVIFDDFFLRLRRSRILSSGVRWSSVVESCCTLLGWRL